MSYFGDDEEDDEIAMTPVASSNVSAVGWKGSIAGEPVMRVEFLDGRVYRYPGVPQSVFQRVRDAASVGRELRKLVIDTYPGEEE